jgi:hypothetical protein
MSTFATVGKKVDDRIESFSEKVREAIDGLDASLKSADRQGFERGQRLAAFAARKAGNETIAVLIEKILYTPGK